MVGVVVVAVVARGSITTIAAVMFGEGDSKGVLECEFDRDCVAEGGDI